MKTMRNLCLIAVFLLSLNSCANNRRETITQQETEEQSTANDYQVLGNEEVTMADGKINHLQDLLNKNGLTLIDCWASWCMPCRRAIPHLKEMSQNYADRLTIVSISCDKNEADWRKAMEEEGMTWQQAIVKDEQAAPFMTAYNIQYIPYLMLIKDGNIVLATNNPADIAAYLQANK